MTKKEYLAKRKALVEEAEALVNEGKLGEFAAKEKEINDLDAKFEDIAKAQANLSALKDKVAVADVAVDMQAGVVNVVDVTGTSATPKDEKQAYLSAWAKAMMGQKLEGDERTMFDKVNLEFRNTVQTANTHAVVIPETVAAEIWREAKELYPIIDDAVRTFVPGDLTILQETNSGADAAWYDEDTEVADGEFAIVELNLTGCELAKAVPISWKLRKMSIERFIPYVTGLLGEKMGAALAKGIVSGRGKPGQGDNWKPEPKGIVTAIEAEANTPQVVEYVGGDKGGMGYGDLTAAMGKIKSKYKKGAAIYAQSTVIWDQLANMLDGQGRPLFIPDVTAGGIGRMFGLPVKEEDSVPDESVLIGNVARGYTANVNEDMTIYTEDHVKKRYTDYMSYAIIDGAPLTTNAFALIKPEEV